MVTNIPVNIKKLRNNATIPTYGSANAAGADLYACLDEALTIAPHETFLVPTGVAMELPEGYAGLIYARSGLASKKGLAPANKVGVVDSDYRGEVMVALHNHSEKAATIEPQERIAQLVITPYIAAAFNTVDELDSTERGAGGFGSTGTH
ncbi:MAG: dUTP diphosphatase [Lachnospiraceae bacterium]|nr:dUTP diphosphatase [Lachnospiraceae bacterium]